MSMVFIYSQSYITNKESHIKIKLHKIVEGESQKRK